MRRLAAFEPESVVCLTGRRRSTAEPAAVVIGLREVARPPREAGVRLGLEPAPGHDPSRSSTVAEALELLDEAELGDVGVMADTFNLWNEAPGALAAVADRVTGLHVADAPREPGREDRVLPGEGGTRSAEHVRRWRGGLGRIPRRRDLLDSGSLLGTAGGRGRTRAFDGLRRATLAGAQTVP